LLRVNVILTGLDKNVVALVTAIVGVELWIEIFRMGGLASAF
jgi:hypothetical protein